MALDIEIAGVVRELREEETHVRNPPSRIKGMRDSHHAAAKLIARGLSYIQVSLQTGYTVERLYILANDPTFKELIEFYRKDQDAVAAEVEHQWLGIAKDTAQAIHERVMDAPEEIPVSQLNEIFKTFADRAGYAPISRSVNKNLNVNIGDRLDAARRKKDAA